MPLLGLAACATGPRQDLTHQMRTAHAAGAYAAAADAGAAALALSPDGDDLLQALEAGLALHAAGRWQESNAAFDAAEERLMWKSQQVQSVADAARLLGGMLAGDDSFPYPGRIYEGILVNTYKGLNDIMLGDAAAARVEFNRMAARQENAALQLQAKAAALRQQPDPAADQPGGASADIAAARRQLTPEAEARLAAVPRFPRDGDIRNPYSYYLAGWFRAATGLASDLAIARTLLRDAAVLSGTGEDANPYAVQDFAALEKGGTLENRVLLVYEDGQGPVLDEWRIDLPPLLDGQGGMLPVSLALPVFRTRAAAHQGLQVRADGRIYPVRRLLDVDALAGTEFRAGYDGLVARAITAAVLKALAVHTASRALEDFKTGPDLAGFLRFAMIASQMVTTRADTRMVQLLPKSVAVASFPFPEDGIVEIHAADGTSIGRFSLTPPAGGGPVVVRVRIPVAGAPAALHASGTIAPVVMP